nr:zinc finger MYM-type protein 1-like [Tanacetum cinerariifolium]
THAINIESNRKEFGSMHRYVKIKSDVTNENLNVDTSDNDSSNDESGDDVKLDDINVDNMEVGDQDVNVNVDHVDIFNLKTWDNISSDMIKVLVAKDSKRDKSIDKGNRLKEHEVSLEHLNNMANWFEMRRRLKKNETIDKLEQKQFEKERDHRKNVIIRIICIVKFLAKPNLAFRGSNERISNVDDTTGQELFDVTQAELKALDLDDDDLLINVAITEVQDLIYFFKEFRVNGFSNAVNVAKKIALEMDINPLFIKKGGIRRKRHFHEAFVEEDVMLSVEESLKLYDDDRLKSCCSRLESALKNGDLYDINVNELYVELSSSGICTKKLLKTEIDKVIYAVINVIRKAKWISTYSYLE